jgi:TRAP-type C4-dicarboxylate transport system permease small subunit
VWLQKTVNVLAKGVEPVTRWAHNIGSGVLAAMMFLTAADVTLRYAFNSPILGSYELQEFMMVTMIAMGIGYCAFLKGHINVDILFNKLPQRVQATFNVFHYLIAACLFALVTWRTFLEGLLMQSRNMTSTVLYIPVLPFYCVAAFGSAVLCLAFLYNSIESLSKVFGKWNR